VANLIDVLLIVVAAKSWGMVPRLTFRAALARWRWRQRNEVCSDPPSIGPA
jgi:hypothetical protein